MNRSGLNRKRCSSSYADRNALSHVRAACPVHDAPVAEGEDQAWALTVLAEDKADESARRRDDLQAEYEKVLGALKTQLARDDAHLKRLVTLHGEMEKLRAEQVVQLLAELANKLAELKKDKNETEAKLQAALREALKVAELKIQKLDRKVPRIDLLAYEQPKGKIIAVDAGQLIVHLNLGSADFVKPGLTFSVYGEAEYQATAERKAAIEVVEVVGEHKCRARVTELKNAVRRPIVLGDQLYNPAWTPGLRDHVAIVGAIDLNGDGRDGTAEFVKALEKEGTIVDAWTDMKELTLKGARKAINLQTNYLIVGDLPEVAGELAGNPIDPRLEKELAMRKTISGLHDAASQLGLSVVNARRYLAVAGMKVPKPAAAASKTRQDEKKGP